MNDERWMNFKGLLGLVLEETDERMNDEWWMDLQGLLDLILKNNCANPRGRWGLILGWMIVSSRAVGA